MGLCPWRALLAPGGGALRALCGSVRGLAAGPETHFGFQTVTEAERREKSKGGGGVRALPRGRAGWNPTGLPGSGAEGAAETGLELGPWCEALPGVSASSVSVVPARLFPSAPERVMGRGCVPPETFVTGSAGFDRTFCKAFSAGVFQFHMVSDLHEAIKDTFYFHRGCFK